MREQLHKYAWMLIRLPAEVEYLEEKLSKNWPIFPKL